MKLNIFSYLITGLILTFIYWFFLYDTGYRLPINYTPDGRVSIFSDTKYEYLGSQIKTIQNQNTNRYPVVSIFKDSVKLETNTGKFKVKVIKNNFWKIINELKFFIIATFIFFFCAVWFFINTRDFYLVSFNATLATSILSFILILTKQDFLLFFQISSLCTLISIFNLGLRTTGKIIYSYIIILEISFVLFFSLIAYIGKENVVSIDLFNKFIIISATVIIIFILNLQLRNVFKKTDDKEKKTKRIILFIGGVLGLFIPVIILLIKHFNQIYIFKLINLKYLKYLYLVIFIYPVCLIFATYRLQLVPFQILFSKSVLVFIQSSIFAIIYAVAIFLENMLLPDIVLNSKIWIVHILIIVLLIFLFEPLKYFINVRLNFRSFWQNPKLENSIQKMIKQITTHSNIQVILDFIFDEILNILKLKKIDLLLSELTFPDLKLRKNSIIRINSNSENWKYLFHHNIIATDYFTYASGSHKELYNFLFINDYVLTIGATLRNTVFNSFNFINKFIDKIFKKNYTKDRFENMKAAMAIGSKIDNSPFKFSEVLYLIKASKLVHLIFENYTNLLLEIEKRQRIRELQIAGNLQRKLPGNNKRDFKNIEYALSSKPALNVSGDYLEIFKVKINLIACVLADVSGHGLGTGYLASTIRGIIRTNLIGFADLSQSFNEVNKYFLNRYSGNEFVTMVAFLINTKTGEVEYINAAHPAPFIIKSNSNEHIYLTSFSPILGVLPLDIKSKKFTLESGDRLFVFSDGVTETFNLKNEVFGDEELNKVLIQNKNKSLQDIINLIEDRLLLHRASSNINDDTTMAIIEYTKNKSFIDYLIKK